LFILYTRMTSTNDNSITVTKFDCDCCNYHTNSKKNFNKHLLTAKHSKNNNLTHAQNTTTTTTTTNNSIDNNNDNDNENDNDNNSIDNTLNRLPYHELKLMLIEMITQQVSAIIYKQATDDFNQQNLEKDKMVMLMGPIIFELVELIRNHDGTSRQISTSSLSREATSFINEVVVDAEQLSIIKANREQRELEATIRSKQAAQDRDEEDALEAEKTAMLLALKKKKERMKDKNELTHKGPNLIRQFKK
jgi:hypothetical protein